jgi:hypothetical protein
MKIFDANTMAALTKELISIILQETALLRSFKIAEIKPLLTRKQEIALMLEKQKEHLAANPSLAKTLTPEQHQNLQALAAEYDSAVQEYQEQLFKAQRINGLLIKKITDTVTEHVTQNRGYNRNGTQTLYGTELARNTPAIKFNENI